MTTLKHTFTSPVVDDHDPNEVGPDEWNADHVSDHPFLVLGAVPGNLTGAREFVADSTFLDTTDAGAGSTLTIGVGAAKLLAWLSSRSTSDLPEGSNKYFTDPRAVTAVQAAGTALTKTDDTNVTLTLGGTPATALLRAVSLTLGWTGLLGLARGGTHADLSATGGTGQYLKQAGVGADITVGTIPAGDIGSGAALTRTNDTNVTVTLGGTPATALLAAVSLTLGWTGALSIARGGTGQTTKAAAFDALSPMTAAGDLIIGGASGTGTALALPAPPSYLTGKTGVGPAWAPNSALTKTDDTNVTLTLGGTPTTSLLAAVSLTLGWTGQLSIARGGTGQATKAAAFDALSPLTTQGDILVGGASGTGTRVAPSIPSAGSLVSLTFLNGDTIPVWRTTADNTAPTTQAFGDAAAAGSANKFARIDHKHAMPALANPTGSVGLTAVNGSAATAMRSDGAPALSQAITPTWSANHVWNAAAQAYIHQYAIGGVGKFGLAMYTGGHLGWDELSVATRLKLFIGGGSYISGPLNVDATGIQIAGAATAGNVLKSNGTYFTDGHLNFDATDLKMDSGQYTTWTPGYTGFSANPTVSSAKWIKVGSLVFITYQYSALGTSNANTFTITGLPFAPANTIIRALLPSAGADGGANMTTNIWYDISGTTMTLFNAVNASNAWTASGAKGVYFFSIFYQYA